MQTKPHVLYSGRTKNGRAGEREPPLSRRLGTEQRLGLWFGGVVLTWWRLKRLESNPRNAEAHIRGLTKLSDRDVLRISPRVSGIRFNKKAHLEWIDRLSKIPGPEAVERIAQYLTNPDLAHEAIGILMRRPAVERVAARPKFREAVRKELIPEYSFSPHLQLLETPDDVELLVAVARRSIGAPGHTVPHLLAVRGLVLQSLIRIGPNGVEKLVSVVQGLWEQEEYEDAVMIGRVLAKIGDARAIEPILQLARTASGAKGQAYQGALFLILAQLGCESVAPSVLESARHSVKFLWLHFGEEALALAHLKYTPAVPLLLEVAFNHCEAETRSAAFEALTRFGPGIDDSVVPFLYETKTNQRAADLLRALRFKPRSQSEEAWYAAGCGDPLPCAASVQPLLALAGANDRRYGDYTELQKHLEKCARTDPSAIPLLVAELRNPSVGIRQTIARTLRTINWVCISPVEGVPFHFALRDFRGIVSHGRASVPPAIEMLSSSVDRDFALRIIARLPTVESIEPLRQAMDREQEEETKKRILSIIGLLMELRTDVEGLLALLDESIRSSCMDLRDPSARLSRICGLIWRLQDLGWSPRDESHKACVAVIERRYEEASKYGSVAFGPLLAANCDHNNFPYYAPIYSVGVELKGESAVLAAALNEAASDNDVIGLSKCATTSGKEKELANLIAYHESLHQRFVTLYERLDDQSKDFVVMSLRIKFAHKAFSGIEKQSPRPIRRAVLHGLLNQARADYGGGEKERMRLRGLCEVIIASIRQMLSYRVDDFTQGDLRAVESMPDPGYSWYQEDAYREEGYGGRDRVDASHVRRLAKEELQRRS